MSEQLSAQDKYIITVREVLSEMGYDFDEADIPVIEACYVAHLRLKTLEVTEFQADQLVREGQMRRGLYMEGVKAGMNEYATVIEPIYATGLGRLSNMLQALGLVESPERGEAEDDDPET